MAMQVVNVGLVGYGFAGKVFHAPLIGVVEGLRLTHVASSDAAKVQRDLPRSQVVANAQALLAAPEIDLVVIATPNQSHFGLAQQALVAGKHVVVDKPFVVHASEGEELARLAAARGKVLSVFHNRRWDNDFLTLREVLRSGVLGTVHSYEAHFDRFRPQVRAERWREQDQPGAGVLYDLGSHLIDQALCLFGRPQTVWAQTAVQRAGGKSVDSFRLVLGYRDRTAVLRAASLVRNPGPRYQVHGTRGSFLKHGLDPQEDALRQGVPPGAPGWGQEAPALFGEIAFDNGALRISGRVETLPGCYQGYYGELHAAIAEGKAPPVPAREAIDVIRVIEAAMKSANLGTTIDLA
jgi:scyllo-inositol 2-dehydrogenase (NADP+)